MRVLSFAAAALAVVPLFASAQAGDTATRTLAASCAICHGTDGVAASRDAISLAGLPKDHIARQMRDLRDGRRPATVMHQIGKGYTDAEIDRLAAWFAAQKR